MTTPTLPSTELTEALARQAQRVGHADVDLPLVLAGGSRLRRRRRALSAAAVGAVAASVVAGATLAPSLLGSGSAENSLAASTATSTSHTGPFVFATTSEVHLDDARVSLPGRPEQLVQVASGAVLLAEGRVWWVRPGENPLHLGSYAPSNIPGGVRAYGNGDQVGWISVNENTTVVQVVDLGDPALDVKVAELDATSQLPREPEQTRIPLVLDGETAYVQDHSGVRSISLDAPNTAPRVLAPPASDLHLLDAESGNLIWSVGDARTEFGTVWGTGTDLGVDIAMAQLSPGGRYVVGDASGKHVVIEPVTGRTLVVDVGVHNDVLRAVHWTSEQSFVLQAFPDSPIPYQGQDKDRGTPEFRSCIVPDAGTSLTCTLLPGVSAPEGFLMSATNIF